MDSYPNVRQAFAGVASANVRLNNPGQLNDLGRNATQDRPFWFGARCDDPAPALGDESNI